MKFDESIILALETAIAGYAEKKGYAVLRDDKGDYLVRFSETASPLYIYKEGHRNVGIRQLNTGAGPNLDTFNPETFEELLDKAIKLSKQDLKAVRAAETPYSGTAGAWENAVKHPDENWEPWYVPSKEDVTGRSPSHYFSTNDRKSHEGVKFTDASSKPVSVRAVRTEKPDDGPGGNNDGPRMR